METLKMAETNSYKHVCMMGGNKHSSNWENVARNPAPACAEHYSERVDFPGFSARFRFDDELSRCVSA